MLSTSTDATTIMAHATGGWDSVTYENLITKRDISATSAELQRCLCAERERNLHIEATAIAIGGDLGVPVSVAALCVKARPTETAEEAKGTVLSHADRGQQVSCS